VHKLSRVDGGLKSLFAGLALAFVLFGCCIVPSMGQGVTAGFTLYVRFFYPIHWLYNLQVTIYDQTGKIVGTGFSPDGSLVVIPVRTEHPTNWLSASALGYASDPLTVIEASPRFWVVGGTSTIPVENIGGDYWVVIQLSQ